MSRENTKKVKCEIGLKSINLPYVFVSLYDNDNEVTCVWAKPEDLVLERQPLAGQVLNGWLRCQILKEEKDTITIKCRSNGKDEKVLMVPKANLAML